MKQHSLNKAATMHNQREREGGGEINQRVMLANSNIHR